MKAHRILVILFGAMVFGAPGEERLQLNENTLWTGCPHDYTNPEASKSLPKVRKLIFDGNGHAAEKLGAEQLMGSPVRLRSYQPLGDLRLKFAGHEEALEHGRRE